MDVPPTLGGPPTQTLGGHVPPVPNVLTPMSVRKCRMKITTLAMSFLVKYFFFLINFIFIVLLPFLDE